MDTSIGNSSLHVSPNRSMHQSPESNRLCVLPYVPSSQRDYRRTQSDLLEEPHPKASCPARSQASIETASCLDEEKGFRGQKSGSLLTVSVGVNAAPVSMLIIE